MKKVGFWDADNKPEDFEDPSWDLAERDAVATYLTKNTGRTYFRNSADVTATKCRICAKSLDSTHDVSDLVWVWPQEYGHYLTEHNLKPSEEFIEHVLARSGIRRAWTRVDEPVETPERREKRMELEFQTLEIADRIKDLMPDGTTFILITASVGKDGSMGYVGTLKRESAIELMKELLHRWGVNS
jgi:hypothetical protein